MNFPPNRLIDNATADRLVNLGAPVVRVSGSLKVAAPPLAVDQTELDRLRADPFAFYAKRILALRSLDPVDAGAQRDLAASQLAAARSQSRVQRRAKAVCVE